MANAGQYGSEDLQSDATAMKDAVLDNVTQMASKVKDYAKANPAYALVGAAVVGFLIGRLMPRE